MQTVPIIRIVKMTFHPEKVKDFLNMYEATNAKIRASKGCTHLELLNDIHQPNVLFTYSLWDSENDLLNYRNSDFFASTWDKAKAMFAAEAEAWSLEGASKQ